MDSPLTKRLRPDLAALKDAPGAGAGLRRVVSDALSACRAFDRGRLTHVNLAGPMATFWQRVQAAALVSGTLYVDTAEHGVSAGLYAGRLYVPSGRRAELPRTVAPWLLTTPTVLLPPDAAVTQLVPPQFTEDVNRDHETATAAYHDALASACRLAADTAAGGTLVLCTNYATIAALAERLRVPLGGRLLTQSPDHSFGVWRHRFLQLRQTERVVWLATGPAWTRLPVPVQAGRRVKLGIVRIETALRLRQGMGRLVRAEGQPDRRLWICDGRLWSGDARHAYLVGPSLRAIHGYPDRHAWP